MVACPQCYSSNIAEDESSEPSPGQSDDFFWSIYICQDCGCKWEESTKITVTILEDGDSILEPNP